MNKQQYQKAYNQYLNSLPSMKKSINTVKAYSLALRKFEDYLNGIEHTGDISPIDVVNFRTALSNTGIKSNTIKQYLIGLHSFFESAIRMKLTEENPVQMEEIPKAEPIEYDLLNMDEIKKVLNNQPKIKTKQYFRDYAIVSMFILTGLRNRELRFLRLSDLDFENCTVRVGSKSAKGSKERRTAFPALARDIIKLYLESGYRPSYLKDDDYLFGNFSDEKGHTNKAENQWKPFSSQGLTLRVKLWIKKHTGRENIGSHDLRHAFASVASEMGVPTRQLSLSMGHSSESTTSKIYISILNKDGAAHTVNVGLDRLGAI